MPSHQSAARIATAAQPGRAQRVLRRLRDIPAPLLQDPASLSYAPEWVASLFFGRNPLDDHTPWLPFKVRRWLFKHVGAGDLVFEYGSGGSTLFFARLAGSVVSVEHDRAWFERVGRALRESALRNYEHVLREPEVAEAGQSPGPASQRPEFAGRSFDRYVRSIDEYSDRSFDLVVVDGRARLACLDRAIPKVRDGGYLLLDNSERAEYAPAFSMLSHLPRLDLRGLAPYRTYLWQTSIWGVRHSRRTERRWGGAPGSSGAPPSAIGPTHCTASRSSSSPRSADGPERR